MWARSVGGVGRNLFQACSRHVPHDDVTAAVGCRWVDGPLVLAMRQGDMILIDEVNLAEDAVLERLNRWVRGAAATHRPEPTATGAETGEGEK
jgi:hypothetical protein